MRISEMAMSSITPPSTISNEIPEFPGITENGLALAEGLISQFRMVIRLNPPIESVPNLIALQ